VAEAIAQEKKMQRVLLAVAILGLPVAGISAQSHHQPAYLVGGYWSSSTLVPGYWKGLWLYDKTGASPALRWICSMPYAGKTGALRMDYDNRNLILATDGTMSSAAGTSASGCLLRYDTSSNVWNTFYRFPRRPGDFRTGYMYHKALSPLLDQNGDYLVPVQRYERITSPTTISTAHYRILKIDPAARVTTVLTTTQLNPPYATAFLAMTRDIDSGKLMVLDSRRQYTPSTVVCPVWTLDPEDGYRAASIGVWHSGAGCGWTPYAEGFEQNVKNGCLEGLYASGLRVVQLRPGSSPLTTLSTITGLPALSLTTVPSRFDLQTASNPRHLLAGYALNQGAWLCHYDVRTWTLTTFDTMVTTASYRYPMCQQLEFYRGRHIQTVRTAPNRWDIRLSCPHLPNRRYVLVAGISGVRPAIPLADGRTVNLAFDLITVMTVGNALKPYWDPGPGVLDPNGEAVGRLDLSALPIPRNGLGMPFWIAMAVIDPAAPIGIAYLPDTYVMRL